MRCKIACGFQQTKMILHGIKDIDVLLLFITLLTCVLQERVLSMVTPSNFSEFETDI